MAAAPADKKIKAHYHRVVTIDNYEELIKLALADDVITETEAERIREAQELSYKVISVDDFDRADVEPGYRN